MKSIDPLIAMTAEITQIPLSTVEEIIDHEFATLRYYLKHPDKPVIKIDELGRFELKPNIIKRWLAKLLRELKEDRNNEELKRLFSFWWKASQDALKYYENKKRK